MAPAAADREALFQAFARALFARDMEALERVVAPGFVWRYHDGESVTREMTQRAEVLQHLEEQRELFSEQRFHAVEYHHLPSTTLMTFRVSEIVRETGERREQVGVERYLFENDKIVLKDVYRKPV